MGNLEIDKVFQYIYLQNPLSTKLRIHKLTEWTEIVLSKLF